MRHLLPLTAPLLLLAGGAARAEIQVTGAPASATIERRDGATILSLPVPEGNHRVTIEARAGTRPATLIVRAEDRRLMLAPLALGAGETATRKFVVNVRRPGLLPPPENAPGGTEVVLPPVDRAGLSWDDLLTLEFGSDATVERVRIDPADVPTLYLAGDSTVADQPREPTTSWGGMLPALLDDGVAVANHARSGATLKSFATDLRLAKLLQTLRAGDWLFIQFGHNDQKAGWPQTYADPALAYPAWLRTYVAEARARGAQRVIVTPPERRTFDGGRIRSTLAEHAAAARTVAEEERVPLIDLNAASWAIYEALGPERAPLAFSDGGRDATHHSSYGAWLLANAVAAEIRRTVPELARHVVAAPFDPASPPALEGFALPPSVHTGTARPEGS